MNFIKMKCNNCNGQLEIDLDHLHAYCPYCGQKLMMDFEQLGRVLSEKEKTKRTVTREEEQTKRTQMVYENESKEKDKDWKRKVIGTIGIVIVCFFVFYYVFDYMPAHMFDSDEKKHDEKVIYLQQIEIEVEDAIKAEDYDTALLKANKLYCDDNWSNEETTVWDAKREAYIEIIHEKKREQDIKNPNNIFMPASSSSLKRKNYADVEDQLSNLGFTNITTQEASESAGLFDKADTVEHILIGGKTEFTIEDYFDKDTPIIIYYYKK